MEDEPARVLAPLGGRPGVKALGFEFSVLRHLRPGCSNPGRKSRFGTRTCQVAGTAPKAAGRVAVGVGTSSFLVWKVRRRRGNGL